MNDVETVEVYDDVREYLVVRYMPRGCNYVTRTCVQYVV